MPKIGERAEHQPPTEPLRRLSQALLGASMQKGPNKVVIFFDDRADASAAHRVLASLQDSYVAPK